MTIPPVVRLAFNYVNWRDEAHRYLVDVEGLDVGLPNDPMVGLVMHAQVVTRDGDPRCDMGPTRRRTFVVSGMREIEKVSRVSPFSTSPHPFRPLRFWDARGGGRCKHCFLPANAHPVRCWVPARPLGDKSKAELSFDNLSTESTP